MKRVSFVLVSVILAVNLSVQAIFRKKSVSHLSLYLFIHPFIYRFSLMEDTYYTRSNNWKRSRWWLAAYPYHSEEIVPVAL